MHFFTRSETLVVTRLARLLISIGGILLVCLILYWGTLLIERNIQLARPADDDIPEMADAGIEKDIIDKFKATLPRYDPDSTIDEPLSLAPILPGLEEPDASNPSKRRNLSLFKESRLFPLSPIDFPVTRVIENRQGKQLHATLLGRPSENEVRLRRRRDGRLFTVRLEILSDGDQEFIRALPES